MINRRNVRENVDAAVNLCRKFFALEIKARLIAFAVHKPGMNNLSDSPTGEFCQPNLPEASDIEKKECLHKVASRVVDSYFSNSLIIHQAKTKKITTVKEVWIPGLN